MNVLREISRATTTVALLLATGLAAHAQTDKGVLAGNVFDSTGAAVPNAAIAAKSVENGTVFNAQSSSAGNYRFPSIPLGHYNVSANAPGFKQIINNNVEVRVGTTTSLDLTLTTGSTSETVSVEANAPQVETESSDVGGTVTDRQIIELPLALGGVGAMRSPESFVFLIPGTVGPGSGNSNNGIFISKIGGGQNFGNEVLLDGASQTRSENGSSFDEEALSVEAISEFKVTTSTPAAEFGRTSGGVENFVTKSGTNHLHGSAFGIFRNEFLDANDWFANGRKAYYNSKGNTAAAFNNRRPSDKQYDFGISAGGPAVIPHIYNGRDRTFAFFSWEQYRLTAGGVINSSVPTTAERNGDFSDRLINGPNGQINPCDGTPILNGQIFDPSTTRTVNGVRCRTAFPGNRIPANRFSAVGKNIAAFFPAPTDPNALVSNYSLASASALFNTTYSIRVDQSIGSKDHLFGSYSSRENTRNNPTNYALPAPVTPNVQTQDFITHFGRAGWDHNFTANVLNHFNLGFNRSNSINGSVYQQSTTANYSPQLGLPFTTGFPRVVTAGYTDLSRNQTGDNIDNGVRVNDSVNWIKGRHSFKFGVDWRYQQYSTIAADQANGYLSFQGAQTSVVQNSNLLSSGTGNGFASLLLGQGDNAQSTVRAHQPRWISNYWAGFVQDDFKVSNSLVLNLGVRYDVDQPRREAQNFTSNFDPSAIDPKNGRPGAFVFATQCTPNCNPRWANTYYKDVAPRIGFAFSPVSRGNTFAVRGGYAMLYAALLYNDFGGGNITGYTVPTLQNSDGFDPAFSLDAAAGSGGVQPSFVGTNLNPGILDNGNALAPNTFGNYIKSGYGRPAQINQWNLQVQQEFTKDLIFTLGYIGSSGSHLHSGNENVNNMPKSNFYRGDVLNRCPNNVCAPILAANGVASPYASFNGQVQQALRPFPQYGFIATDCCLQNTGHSSYEALIASVDRRFRNGLSLTASYTWSKTITNADSALPGTNAGVQQVQDPFDSRSQKSLSIQDIPHTFVVSFLGELPFGKGKPFLNFNNPVARSLVSGFELGGVLRYQSGQPTSFGTATRIPGWDNFIEFSRVPGSTFVSNARRNGKIDPFRNLRNNGNVPGPDPNVDSEFNGLLRRDNGGYSALQNAPAFYDQNQGANRLLRARQAGNCATCDNGDYQFGSIPRVTGEVRNYLYNNEDFSFLKKTPLGEARTLFLKIELLNAFNRHIFSTPNLDPYNPLFGVPTGTIDGPRKIQLTGRIQF